MKRVIGCLILLPSSSDCKTIISISRINISTRFSTYKFIKILVIVENFQRYKYKSFKATESFLFC